MPRRREVPKRKVMPDPQYGDRLVAKFINCLMLRGKKAVAEQILYGAFEIIERRTKDDPLRIFKKAVENVKPSIEVRSKRVGGAAYQVPMQVNRVRQQSLSFRWILMAVHDKKGRPTAQKLADELAAAYKREGAAMTRRENVHRMA